MCFGEIFMLSNLLVFFHHCAFIIVNFVSGLSFYSKTTDDIIGVPGTECGYSSVDINEMRTDIVRCQIQRPYTSKVIKISINK